MKEIRFFICKHCGNIVGMIHDSGVPLVCCGEKMAQLIPGEVEASAEKHIPVVSCSGNSVSVSVGSVPHPMEAAHFIEWVYLRTNNGGHRRALAPGETPCAVFALAPGESPVAAYAYCNLHGLWKTEL